jgi:hypothetical protein
MGFWIQVTHSMGSYPHGLVHIAPLPAEVHGASCSQYFSLRRLEGVVEDSELAEHCKQELKKVGACVCVRGRR